MTRCAFSERTSDYVAMSELVANTIGDLLGHPYFVERMGRRNSGAWQRFVLALRVAHDGRAGGISKNSQKYLSGLYKRYVKAVDAAEQGVRLSSMVDEEEKEKAPENGAVGDERGSRRKVAKYISFRKIGTEAVRQIRAKLAELYDGQDGVADGVAVAVGEMVYVVDSGCENGEISFGVRLRETFTDHRLKEDYVRRRNNDALSKGHVSDGLSVRLRSGLGRHLDSDLRQKSGTELQADPRESGNNAGGASEQAAGKRGRVSTDERKSKRKVIDLSNDDKLSALVKDVHGSKRYNIIREYILTELSDQPIRLSDGKMAVVDKRDAQHMARGAGTKKTMAISHIKEIVESAELVAEEESTKENKFSHFWYYEAHALYEGEPISLYINVGQARNAPSYHIYDITKKIRDTAHRIYDVGRPVGHAILNGISDKSISHPEDFVNRENLDERKSKKVSQVNLGNNFKEDKYYARQIDGWESLKEGGYITVGEIARKSPLNLVGVPIGTLYFDNSKIFEAMSTHDDHLSLADLKSIPALLDCPIVITEYKPGKESNTVSVYGNLTTANGTPIVVGIVITKGVNKNIITKVRTVHARGDFKNQITDASVLYLGENKKETKAWFRLLGIDVPLEGVKFGFIRSISHSDDFVNRGNLDERKSIKHPSFSEKEISNNMEALADMKAVVSIDASKLEKTGKKPKDLFVEFFNSLGNNIYSDVFGDIALSASSAKSEIRHGVTAEKVASIEAIPTVIKKGKVIFHKAKEAGTERIVVCAPIKIGENDYYMGVMLQRDARYQSLYLHNVVSLAIERETNTSSKDILVTTGALEEGNRLSMTSILQKAVNVKIKKQKSNRQLLEPTDERYSKKKAHRKTDVAAVMRAAISKHLRVGDSYGKLLGATAKEAKERLYIELNDAVGKENESAVAFDIADFLIDNAVVEAFESSPEATKNAEAVAKFDAYLHRIDTSGIRDEIRSRFSKDNSVHALWSLRRGYNAIPIETVKAELEKNGVAIDASEPVDVLFEIHNARKAAKEALESTGYALVKNSLSEEEREIARQEIAKDILEGCRVKSLERQAFDVIYDRAKQRAEVWKARYYDEVQKNFITNRLLDKTRKLSDLKLGRFMNATQSKGKVELFKGSIFRLARIRFRGNLNKRGTRKIFATLYAWYTDENNRIVRNSEGKLHDENIAAILARVANNEKPLSDAENAAIDAIDALHKTAAWPLPRGCFVSIFIQIRRYIFSKALIHSRAINSCP